MKRSIWIGFDPREVAAFAVARASINAHRQNSVGYIPKHGLVLADLQTRRLYRRPTERVLGRLQDVLSRRSDYNGEISTEFAISRFLVPRLARSGMALFMDCDMMLRQDIGQVFDACAADPSKALWCVQHPDYVPGETEKMDGQLQTRYARKNWSSFMVFNCDHPSNAQLTLDVVNTWPGRDLHSFNWLADDEIGRLDPAWNHLVGQSPPMHNPANVHWTLGGPWFDAMRNAPFSAEYFQHLQGWARG